MKTERYSSLGENGLGRGKGEVGGLFRILKKIVKRKRIVDE